MPIYEYHCRECGHDFEEILVSKRDRVSCPTCTSQAVEKQLSVFSSPGSRSDDEGSPGGCGSCSPGGCGCH